MPDIEVKKGEIKSISFTVTDSDGAAVDLSTADIKFRAAANNAATTYDIDLTDSDFTESGASNQITTAVFDFSSMEGDYVGYLQITFSASNIDISKEISIKVSDTLF